MDGADWAFSLLAIAATLVVLMLPAAVLHVIAIYTGWPEMNPLRYMISGATTVMAIGAYLAFRDAVQRREFISNLRQRISTNRKERQLTLKGLLHARSFDEAAVWLSESHAMQSWSAEDLRTLLCLLSAGTAEIDPPIRIKGYPIAKRWGRGQRIRQHVQSELVDSLASRGL
jgi:hypothetical protein